ADSRINLFQSRQHAVVLIDAESGDVLTASGPFALQCHSRGAAQYIYQLCYFLFSFHKFTSHQQESTLKPAHPRRLPQPRARTRNPAAKAGASSSKYAASSCAASLTTSGDAVSGSG